MNHPTRPLLTRRQTLTALGLCAVPQWAFAKTKVLKQTRSKDGVMLRLALDNAPFPSRPMPYKDNTVLVFVPTGFRPTQAVDLVFFFHGHRSTVDESLVNHAPHTQLAKSGMNAVLVIPQLAKNASESHAGKLERRGGFKRLVTEVLEALASVNVVPGSARPGRIVLAAHSGGYQAAAMSTSVGGLDVHEIIFLDAMYGFSRRLGNWLTAARPHRFVSFYAGPRPTRWTKKLVAALKRRATRFVHLDGDKHVTARALKQHPILLVRTRRLHADVTRYLLPCLRTSGLKPRGGHAPRE